VRAPDVHAWSGLRIIIQSSNAKNHVRLVVTLGNKMTTTTRAKMPDLSWARLVVRQKIFAPEPAEVVPQNTCSRRIRRGVRLAASGAMTVANGHIELIHLVANASAKTRTAHNCCLLMFGAVTDSVPV